MADNNNQTDITTLTVQLLSAFVSNNTVSSDELSGLIQSTRAALTGDLNPASAEPEAPVHVPAVSIRKSLASPAHILSMIDGKPYKTLKRHLAVHGMTPDEYRARYNLPRSYPLVAPNYSEARRAVANKVGLGRKPTVAPAVAPTAPAQAAAAKKPAKTAPKAQPAAAAPAVNGAAKPVQEKLAAAPKKAARKRLSIASPKQDAAAASEAKKPKAKAKAQTATAASSKPAKPKADAAPAKPRPAKAPAKTSAKSTEAVAAKA